MFHFPLEQVQDRQPIMPIVLPNEEVQTNSSLHDDLGSGGLILDPSPPITQHTLPISILPNDPVGRDSDVEEADCEDEDDESFIHKNFLADILANNFPNFDSLGLAEDIRDKANLLLENIKAFKFIKNLQFNKIKRMISKQFPHGTKKAAWKVPEVRKRLFYAVVKRAMQLLFLSNRKTLDLERIMEQEPQCSDAQITQLREADPTEYAILARFVRAVHIAFTVIGIPGRSHKEIYVYLATNLEGADRNYANGGGRAKSCKLRHHVIEMTTGVPRDHRDRLPAVKTYLNCLLSDSEDEDEDEMDTIEEDHSLQGVNLSDPSPSTVNHSNGVA